MGFYDCSRGHLEELYDNALTYIWEIVNDPTEFLRVCSVSIGMTDEEVMEQAEFCGISDDVDWDYIFEQV